MPFDVSILSTNEYSPKEIIAEEIPEKYLYDDKGEFYLTSTIFNSEQTVSQLINFLFRGSQSFTEVFRDKNAYVLDLSRLRSRLIDFAYLGKNYSNWIEISGRDNTMNEYGMLVDFLAQAHKGSNKKFLFLIVSNERHCS